MDFCLRRIAFSVCPVRDLVDVVADGGQLTQKCCVSVRWARAEMFAHDKFAEIGVGIQTGNLTLLSQMCQLCIAEPQTNRIAACPHNVLLPYNHSYCVPSWDVIRRGVLGYTLTSGVCGTNAVLAKAALPKATLPVIAAAQ